MIESTNGDSFRAVMAICVLPYVIPDLVKLIPAGRLSEKITIQKAWSEYKKSNDEVSGTPNII